MTCSAQAPKNRRTSNTGIAATWPSVASPARSSFSAATDPIPGSLRTGSLTADLTRRRDGQAAVPAGSPSRLGPGLLRGYVGGRPDDHPHLVAVPMQNTEAMMVFYRALGLHVMETDRKVSAHFGDQKINFHRPESWQRVTSTSLRAPAARPPCGDSCFVWEGSAESLMAVLDRAGADVIASGPLDGGRALGTVRGTSRYVRDPDGNLLEFMIYS